MANVIIKIKPKSYYRGVKSLDGATYRFTFRWNTYTSKWYFDIKGLSNSLDVKGVAMLPGKDLLAKHGYSDFFGQLWCYDKKGADNPNFDDVGTRWTLEYIPLPGRSGDTQTGQIPGGLP